MSRVLLVDNYDSFTHNLYQLLGEAGADVEVVRNDAVDLAGVRALAPTHVVISPGPGHPGVARDFGVCGELIERLAPTVPTLGVCLGHQGIAHRLGGQVVPACRIMHGKVDAISHDGQGLFAGLPAPLEVMRYHSLSVDRDSLPAELRVTAEADDGTVMALAHRDWPLVGVQFHPESIGTPSGRGLVDNFLAMEAVA
jgi:anthranilate synthase/aminodeoxychorismate synthase-like glutamine amidotransferase